MKFYCHDWDSNPDHCSENQTCKGHMPYLKIEINNFFNISFYRSVLWDLFGAEASRLEKTWNVSLRKMINIPRQTHRYFLEPISKTSHIISLCARFVKFVNKIGSYNKASMINLLNTVMYDCQS